MVWLIGKNENIQAHTDRVNDARYDTLLLHSNKLLKQRATRQR